MFFFLDTISLSLWYFKIIADKENKRKIKVLSIRMCAMIYQNNLDAHKDESDYKLSIGWEFNIMIPWSPFRIG